MPSENTTAMKRTRAWHRLLMGVLEHLPDEDLLLLAADYANSGDSLTKYHSNIQAALNKAVEASENYEPHYQHGCGIPILKNSLLAKKLSKAAAFSPPKKIEEDKK